MEWKIPLFKIYWEKDDLESVSRVIKRGSYWTLGPETEQLEKKIADYVDAKYALSFNSGTSALHADLLAHDVKGGEVIVPSFTFISTANAVVLAGAKPVFAEIEDGSYGLDPKDVKEKITSKTRAIIPVHYGGAPCKEIKALQEISEDHKLFLVEDAAESLGSKIDKKMVGTFGQSAIFSFCQNKIITAGEGGITVTDSKPVYEKLKLIRSHGRLENKENYFSTTSELDYIQLGYNYRMSSITAALVLSQFEKINKIIKMRREKARYYDSKLSKIKNIKTPSILKNHFHVYQMYTIQLKNKIDRVKLQKKLTKAGVMTKVYFNPVHLKMFYREKFNYKKGDLPITEKISEKILTLPLYPELTNKEMDYIVYEIKNCVSD
jgi:dTDP-4-amino-4,6-dideoxygalactose transaminase